jgi:Carboxypeptidase regulatory-like domain
MKKIHLRLLLLFTVILSSLGLNAQNANIRGIITDDYNNPIANAKVILNGTSYETVTDATGVFNFTDIPYGEYVVEIKEVDHIAVNQQISAKQPLVDLGKFALLPEGRKTPLEETLPVVSVEENEAAESSSGAVSSALGASRDVFASAANFTFSVARFDVRGYGDEHFMNYMNGAPMVNLVNGRSIFAWGGLNDVTRNQISAYGMKASNYSFGGVGGSFNVDSRASRQRKQTQVTYSAANRAYENRLMATFGSGIMKGGWAVSASISRRWADEGYMPGTFYDGWSYYASIEKLIGRHSISLTHFGVSTINGRSASTVQEAYDLTGTNYYNPFWGYQDGKKRNSAVNNIFTPLTILQHDWQINNKSTLMTSVSYQFGKEKRGGINWYNAPNPRGDYYRNMPSFIPFLITDPASAAAIQASVEEAIRNNPDLLQLNWTKFYESNTNRIETVNGVTGFRASYMLENRVEDNHNFGFNTVYNNTLSDNFSFSGGLSYQNQKTDYYRELDDLLGADYFVDLNQFAEQSVIPGIDAAQNNLDNPDNIITEGEKFGYNYSSTVNQSQLWVQPEYKGNKIDAFIGAQFSFTDFFRVGNYRNGVFAENSFGKSEVLSFTNITLKGGATYKINGRNYMFANGSLGNRAPFFDDSFISPASYNAVVENLDDVRISSVEGGYSYKAPRLKAQALVYTTSVSDMTHVYRYYNDDVNSFVNLAVSGINQRHNGMEIAAEATVYKGLNVSAVASVGNYYYTSRQLATTTRDNISTVEAKNEVIYSENYKAGAGPQSAYTMGAFYRGKQFWTVGFNVNYFDEMYVRFNPVRRTLAAVESLEDGQQRNDILDQEQLDSQVTLDVNASKSFKLRTKFQRPYRNTYIIINAGINNILNNQDFIQSGNEQLRVDFNTKQANKYATRYTYAFGINYFISVILRMN